MGDKRDMDVVYSPRHTAGLPHATLGMRIGNNRRHTEVLRFMSWYKNKYGKASTMRIIAMMCAVTGCVAVIAGVVGGMAGIGEVAKAWQSKGE